MSEFEWVRTAFIDADARGESISVSGLHESYLAALAASGQTEQAVASETVVNAYWQRLSRAGLARLAHKARHPEQFWTMLGNLHWV